MTEVFFCILIPGVFLLFAWQRYCVYKNTDAFLFVEYLKCLDECELPEELSEFDDVFMGHDFFMSEKHNEIILKKYIDKKKHLEEK